MFKHAIVIAVLVVIVLVDAIYADEKHEQFGKRVRKVRRGRFLGSPLDMLSERLASSTSVLFRLIDETSGKYDLGRSSNAAAGLLNDSNDENDKDSSEIVQNSKDDGVGDFGFGPEIDTDEDEREEDYSDDNALVPQKQVDVQELEVEHRSANFEPLKARQEISQQTSTTPSYPSRFTNSYHQFRRVPIEKTTMGYEKVRTDSPIKSRRRFNPYTRHYDLKKVSDDPNEQNDENNEENKPEETGSTLYREHLRRRQRLPIRRVKLDRTTTVVNKEFRSRRTTPSPTTQTVTTPSVSFTSSTDIKDFSQMSLDEMQEIIKKRAKEMTGEPRKSPMDESEDFFSKRTDDSEPSELRISPTVSIDATTSTISTTERTSPESGSLYQEDSDFMNMDFDQLEGEKEENVDQEFIQNLAKQNDPFKSVPIAPEIREVSKQRTSGYRPEFRPVPAVPGRISNPLDDESELRDTHFRAPARKQKSKFRPHAIPKMKFEADHPFREEDAQVGLSLADMMDLTTFGMKEGIERMKQKSRTKKIRKPFIEASFNAGELSKTQFKLLDDIQGHKSETFKEPREKDDVSHPDTNGPPNTFEHFSPKPSVQTSTKDSTYEKGRVQSRESPINEKTTAEDLPNINREAPFSIEEVFSTSAPTSVLPPVKNADKKSKPVEIQNNDFEFHNGDETAIADGSIIDYINKKDNRLVNIGNQHEGNFMKFHIGSSTENKSAFETSDDLSDLAPDIPAEDYDNPYQNYYHPSHRYPSRESQSVRNAPASPSTQPTSRPFTLKLRPTQSPKQSTTTSDFKSSTHFTIPIDTKEELDFVTPDQTGFTPSTPFTAEPTKRPPSRLRPYQTSHSTFSDSLYPLGRPSKDEPLRHHPPSSFPARHFAHPSLQFSSKKPFTVRPTTTLVPFNYVNLKAKVRKNQSLSKRPGLYDQKVFSHHDVEFKDPFERPEFYQTPATRKHPPKPKIANHRSRPYRQPSRPNLPTAYVNPNLRASRDKISSKRDFIHGHDFKEGFDAFPESTKRDFTNEHEFREGFDAFPDFEQYNLEKNEAREEVNKASESEEALKLKTQSKENKKENDLLKNSNKSVNPAQSVYLKNPFGRDFIRMEVDVDRYDHNKSTVAIHHIPLMVQAPYSGPKPLKKKKRGPLLRKKFSNKKYPTPAQRRHQQILMLPRDRNLLQTVRAAMDRLPSAIQRLPNMVQKIIGQRRLEQPNLGPFKGRALSDDYVASDDDDDETSVNKGEN